LFTYRIFHPVILANHQLVIPAAIQHKNQHYEIQTTTGDCHIGFDKAGFQSGFFQSKKP
jgi:hypothetical protein